jgi:hypothetical protein
MGTQMNSEDTTEQWGHNLLAILYRPAYFARIKVIVICRASSKNYKNKE